MRREAIKFIQQGYAVVPLRGKSPAMPGDKSKHICREPFDVVELWPDDEGFNVGIVTGEGLAVLDIDIADGKDGFGSLARLEAEIGALPVTRRVRTQSGGAHFYFAMPPGVNVTNSDLSLKRFGTGLNVRGVGGHVVAPGMKYEGRPYVLEIEGPTVKIPAALLALLKSPREKSESIAPVGELDTPHEIARARDFALNYQRAEKGSRGYTCARLSRELYDFLISEETCAELLSEWNEAKCDPPLCEDDQERFDDMAERGARDRDNPIGCRSVEALAAVFPGEIETPPALTPEEAEAICPIAARVRDYVCTEEDEAAMPPRPWIAYRRLIRGKMSSIVAPGSAGKSLLALQWACAIAMGDGEWCGLDVRERTKVLVVNGEDDYAEMNQRLGAVMRHFQLPRKEIWHRVKLISTLEDSMTLVKKAGRYGTTEETPEVDAFVDYCKRNGIGAVIFDPMVEFHEASENDNGEMSRVMRAFRKIATKANVSVTLVHHTKKPPQGSADGFAGSMDAGRGASSNVAAVRVGMTLFGMSEKDAQRYSIPAKRRHLYVRLDDAKANLFLASPVAQWFEKRSVILPNEESFGVFHPVDLDANSNDEATAICMDVAELVKVGAEPVTVNSLVTVLSKRPFFSKDSPTTVRNRVIAALSTVDATFNGKRLHFARAGKSGGTVSASVDN